MSTVNMMMYLTESIGWKIASLIWITGLFALVMLAIYYVEYRIMYVLAIVGYCILPLVILIIYLKACVKPDTIVI